MTDQASTAVFLSEFRIKLFVIITILTFLTTSFLTVVIINLEKNNQLQNLQHEGKLLASMLARELMIPLYAGNSEELANHSSRLLELPDVAAVRVLNSSGQTLANASRSDQGKPWQGVLISVPINSRDQSMSPESQLLGDSPSQSSLLGTVELTMDARYLRNHLHHFITVAVSIGLSFWLLVSGACYLLLKSMTRTLSLLLGGIDKIESGDFESRIMVTNNDETGRAALVINRLADTLQQREEENRRLQDEIIRSFRLEMDKEKSKYMAKMLQTNRMTSLGLLVSSMAHEINNPNGIIRLAGNYLSDTWQDTLPLLEKISETEGDFRLGGVPFSAAREEILQAMNNISRSSGRIERVVHNLRSYSLGERNEMQERLDLNRVASNAITIVLAHGKLAATGLVPSLDPELPLIRGNPFQLEQVVVNLLLNAIQSLPPEGGNSVVTVTTGLQQEENEVTLTVCDQGVGIPADHISRLCEPFFSTRISSGGSGLGLYIASFIIGEHQGRLEFKSTPATGTTVTVHLPLPPRSSSPSLPVSC